MPRGRVDEKVWERAKREVAPHADNYDDPYAVVMFVYKKMMAAKKKRCVGGTCKVKKPCADPSHCSCSACKHETAAKKKRKPKR